MAIMAVHNGAPTLAPVLENLRKNDIGLVLIDDGSSDDTPDIAARYAGAPVLQVISRPHDGIYRWRPLLRLKEEIAAAADADWVIHHDADEIFESPVDGETLRAFVERQDALGVDVIDCDEFVFVPRNEEQVFGRGDFPDKMRDYYYFSPPGRTRHQFVRRSSAPLTWARSGGHVMQGPDLRFAAEKLRLRHYIGLSVDHLRAQYLARVFAADELQIGWHRKRVAPNPDFLVAPDPARLWNLDRDGWRRDRPEHEHLFFARETPYSVPAMLASDTQPPGPARHGMPFVIGVGRSGTTLLRLMLDAHPDLAMTPETQWLPPVIAALSRDPAGTDELRKILGGTAGWQDMAISPAGLEQILARHDPARPFDTLRDIYQTYGARFGKSRVGDKTPTHSLCLHQIAQALPEARFIHLIRDGRDVAVSYRDLWFGPGRDVKKAARMWVWRIREARQQAQFLPPGSWLEIRYESLVQDTEPVLRRIGDFLGLNFDPAQLRSHLDAKRRLLELGDVMRAGQSIPAEQRRKIHAQTSSPPDPARIGRYRDEMSREELQAYEQVAGSLLGDLGYRCERRCCRSLQRAGFTRRICGFKGLG